MKTKKKKPPSYIFISEVLSCDHEGHLHLQGKDTMGSKTAVTLLSTIFIDHAAAVHDARTVRLQSQFHFSVKLCQKPKKTA